MPVTIALIDLCQMFEAEKHFPEEFKAIYAKLLEDVNEKTAWLVAADWLAENDELSLARAFRFIGKRPEIHVAKDHSYWRIDGMPRCVEFTIMGDYDCSLIEAVANLAGRIEKALAELE